MIVRNCELQSFSTPDPPCLVRAGVRVRATPGGFEAKSSYLYSVRVFLAHVAADNRYAETAGRETWRTDDIRDLLLELKGKAALVTG